MNDRNQASPRPLILGIGDYFKGDWGLGGLYCETFDAHWTAVGCDVAFLHISEAPRHAATLLMERPLSFAIMGLGLGREVGRLCCVGVATSAYRVLAALDQQHVLTSLAQGLELAAAAGGCRGELHAAVFEPVRAVGVGLSVQAKASMRAVTRMGEEVLGISRSQPPGVTGECGLVTRLWQSSFLGEVV